MSWTFVVVRDNTVEQTKVFEDFWAGAEFTDAFIKNVDSEMPDVSKGFPAYNRGEYYKKDNLSVGLYKSN
jgi:hypothetical protein